MAQLTLPLDYSFRIITRLLQSTRLAVVGFTSLRKDIEHFSRLRLEQLERSHLAQRRCFEYNKTQQKVALKATGASPG